jgi:signal transduction histidine kinase
MPLRPLSKELRALALVALVLGSACTVASAQAPVARTVLTIHWGPEAFPGTESLDAAIRSVLLSQPDMPVNYYTEYLETEEFTPDIASTALRDYIRRKFEGRRIDLVLTNGSAALQFALRYRDDLSPGVPIAFASVSTPELSIDHRPAGVTGVVRDYAIGETLELARHVHPSVKRVFVIAQSPSVSGYDEFVRSALGPYSKGLELVYIKERTVPALLAAVKTIPQQSLILYTRYTPNEAARVMYPDEIAGLIVEAAPVPVYGVAEQYLGTGVVGGVMRDTKTTGTRLGEIASEILRGTSSEKISIGRVPTVPMFDWRQIKRWGIDTSKLPPQSQILFRTPTLWEAYRPYVVGTIVVVIAQLLLIALLLMQRARHRAEETIRVRDASLRTSYERIRQLTGRLINAQEVARASLAQDLHDDVCQRLTAVSMAVDSLKGSSGEIQDPATQQAFEELARDTYTTFEGVRRLSHELHPATLRVLGLAPALNAHCTEVAKRHNVEVKLTIEGDLRHLHPDVAVCYFRIAQESLRNAVAHGDAHRMAVSVTRSGEDIEMTVTDDGRGFDVDAVIRQNHGLGLVSMEERARAVGAALEIVSGPQGTTIRVNGPAKISTPAGGQRQQAS